MNVNEELTDKKFVVNLINTCIGIGILAMPFSFSISQYYSVISIIMAFLLINYAAYCIVKVTLYSYDLYQPLPQTSIFSLKPIPTLSTKQNESDIENTPPNPDSPQTPNTPQSTQTPQTPESPTIQETEYNAHSNEYDVENVQKPSMSTKSVYTIISYKALGKFGAVYGTVGMIVLCTMFLVNILVMNWKLLSGIFNIFIQNYNDDLIYLYVVLIAMPLIFILNWKSLTFIAWIGVIAVTVTTMIIFYLFIKAQFDFDDNNGSVPSSYFDEIDQVNTSQYAQDNMDIIAVIFFSFLTFVSGLAGNGVIGMMVISARNKNIKHIMKLILISYGIVAIYYIFLGIIGQHIYGLSTHVLILNNLFYWPLDDITPIIISIIMIINLFASFVIICGVDSDIIRGIMGIKTEEKCKRIILKLFLLIITGIIGFFARNNLSLLIAIQGCISGLCGHALSMPFALYLGMFWKEINCVSKLFHIFLLLLVFAISGVVAVEAINRLI